MSKTMAEIRADREEQVFQTKLAAVQEHLGDDPVVVATLDRAIDIVKEAGVTDRSEILDLATQMTIDHLSGDGEETEKVASDDIEAAFDAGTVCAEVAFAAGVTTDDIEKIASDEEAEAFGRILAQSFNAAQE